MKTYQIVDVTVDKSTLVDKLKPLVSISDNLKKALQKKALHLFKRQHRGLMLRDCFLKIEEFQRLMTELESAIECKKLGWNNQIIILYKFIWNNLNDFS